MSIRPKVGMLRLFPHMKYQPWYAIGELVDNSIQSYVSNKEELQENHRRTSGSGEPFKLVVDITTSKADGGQIVVRDNAAGIPEYRFEDAFKVAEPPPDATGLSQFGVGMKAAATWFAKRFSVRSSALGEPVERLVDFDIERIIESGDDLLDVYESPIDPNVHFTEVVLDGLHRNLHAKTQVKIREYLASIYRGFVQRTGGAPSDVEIRFDGELLTFDEPKVLVTPRWDDWDGDPISWRREIDLVLESGRRVTGWVAIRETGKASQAGLALLYRRKVVQGGGGDSYRPFEIFRAGNSFRSQRIFGELDLSAFSVTYTKDAIVWYDEEEEFLERLEEILSDDALPILKQADNYRVRRPEDDEVAVSTVEKAADAVSAVIPASLPQPDPEKLAAAEAVPLTVDDEPTAAGSTTTATHHEDITRVNTLDVDGTSWELTTRLISDPSIGAWLSVEREQHGTSTAVEITVNRAHPFMRTFAEVPSQELEPLWRLAVALGLALEQAKAAGDKATFVRPILNDLLRKHFAALT